MPKSPANKRAARVWRDPATLADPNEKFEIIRALNHIELQERWQQPDAISFVKLTLECALKEAIRRKGQRANADHDYWSQTERLADKALAPLRELIAHVKPDGLKYYINMDGYGRLRMRALMRKPDGTTMDKAHAKEELAFLLEAADAIARIRANAVDFRETRPKVRGAEIEHDKHGFVYRLAEGWIFLTGKLPGAGKERNPFLRFVDAAAARARVKTTGFYTGLLAARDHLRQLEHLDQRRPPHVKNHQSISGIREFGPAWWATDKDSKS